MSISWARIFPTGLPEVDEVNERGLAHYENELKLLNAKGIEVMVTLYHWDLPQGLQDRGGWLNRSTIDAYVAFAKVAFERFGPYVKLWATFNEPFVVAWLGYGLGIHAPGRCSDRGGDSATEPYLVAHNILLAHARAVQVYRQQFKAAQGGRIGIVLNSDWAEPYSSSPKDAQAAQRYMEFLAGWFAHPIYKGHYPESMEQIFKKRVPSVKFNATERALVMGSSDFFGLNHYTSVYVTVPDNTTSVDPNAGWISDVNVTTLHHNRKGEPIGPRGDSDWLYDYPVGMYKLLGWIHRTYNYSAIFITENGFDEKDEEYYGKDVALKDSHREAYLKSYLASVHAAAVTDKEKVNVEGYFVWSLMDNFEWADGFVRRFGIVQIDYTDGLTRTAKNSAKWYQSLIAENRKAAGDQVKNKFSMAFYIGLGMVIFIAVTIAIIVIVVIFRNNRKTKQPRYEKVRNEESEGPLDS